MKVFGEENLRQNPPMYSSNFSLVILWHTLSGKSPEKTKHSLNF